MNLLVKIKEKNQLLRGLNFKRRARPEEAKRKAFAGKSGEDVVRSWPKAAVNMIPLFLRLMAALFFCLAAFSQPAASQSPAGNPQEGYRLKDPPKVFLETQNISPQVFSPELLRKELPFVELVASVDEAQVHVLIRAEKREGKIFYTLEFRGLKELAGDRDELSAELPASATEAAVREELLSLLKPGLMRFAGHSAASRRIQVKFLEQVKPTAVSDPWNFWVFSLSLSSFFMGEKSYNSRDIYGSFSANRITPEWKIRLSLSGSWGENEFQYGDQVIKSSYESENFRALVVRSLSEHWSAGAYFSLSSSTYNNVRLSVAPAPAVEYNVFPYSESTRRQLRLLYRLSFAAVGYREETIYFKTKENLWRQSLTASLELKRKWGTVSVSLEGSNYFHDFRQNRVDLSSEISLRIFKGLSLSLNGDYSRIHDQLALPRRGASLEEVLLRRRQLQTSYDYFFSISLNYTFGSILSNIVNPRFGSPGGVSISISM